MLAAVLVAAFLWLSAPAMVQPAYADDLGAATPAVEIDEASRVLFIGNSLTWYKGEGVPDAFRALSEANGKSVEVDYVSYNGAYLSDYTYPIVGVVAYRAALLTKLQAGKWDYVVLQERALRSAIAPMVKMYSSVRTLKGVISGYQPGAQILLYMTHGYDNAVDLHGETLVASDMQLYCQSAYMAIGRRLDLGVVPAGMYFYSYSLSYPNDSLLQSDNKHPSTKGYFLAACAFYQAIFGDIPTEKVAGLFSEDEALNDEAQERVFSTLEGELSAEPVDVTLAPGGSTRLSFSAGETPVTLASLDPLVASVSFDGTVTGVSEGRTIVYAQSSSGWRATCVVSVESAKFQNSKLQFDSDAQTILAVGKSLNLGRLDTGLRVSNTLADYDLAWESSNAAAASVNEIGDVTALEGGKAVITARDTLSGASASYTVFVRLPKPSNVSVSKKSATSLKVKWSPVVGAKKYRVYRSLGSGAFKLVGTTKSTSYTDKKVTANVKVRYQVYAANGVLNCRSKASEEATGVRLSKPSLSVRKKAKGIRLSWKKNSAATGYKIYRKAKGSGKYELVKTVKKARKVNWTDTTAKKKVKYSYKVRSFAVYQDKTFYSPYSKVKAAKR